MGDTGPCCWQLSTGSSGLSWQRIWSIADSLWGDEGAEPSVGGIWGSYPGKMLFAVCVVTTSQPRSCFMAPWHDAGETAFLVPGTLFLVSVYTWKSRVKPSGLH